MSGAGVATATAPSSSAPMYAAVRALVEGLVRAGLRQVCIAPGARCAPLALVMAHDPRLRAWSHIDERCAAFFALGLAKAARAPVAVVCTSGTAAANCFPAVIEARHARVPLVVLTADRPPELRDCGAFQTIDQLKLYGDQVKWFCEVGDPAAERAYFHSLGRRAVATAAAAPPGPVHLNLPLREPLAPAHPAELRPDAGEAVPAPAGSGTAERRLDDAALAALAERLDGARRGIIVCGPLDADAATAAALGALAARRGWPLLADAAAQLRQGAPEHTPVIAAYDALLRDPVVAERLRPDVVLRIGALPISKALLLWLRDQVRCPQIVVDPGGGWNDPLHRAGEVAAVDVAPFCTALAARRPAPERDSAWLERWQRAERLAQGALAERLATIEPPFEGTVMAALDAQLPAGSTLVVGNSMATRDLDTFWPGGGPPRRILCNRGVNGIDGFVSTALGAAAASAGPTVALSGDLGFLHDLNGLLAAARHGVRAVFVVCNNDGGGIFSYLPQADGSTAFDRFIRTPHGLDLQGGVQMYGCGFTRAPSNAAFREALAAALTAARTEVIEVPIDLQRSVALHRELWTAAGRAARQAWR